MGRNILESLVTTDTIDVKRLRGGQSNKYSVNLVTMQIHTNYGEHLEYSVLMCFIKYLPRIFYDCH